MGIGLAWGSILREMYVFFGSAPYRRCRRIPSQRTLRFPRALSGKEMYLHLHQNLRWVVKQVPPGRFVYAIRNLSWKTIEI